MDNYTLQVSITSPIPYFLDKMAYPTAFVVEQSNVQSGANWWQKPIGTGPFKLQQWTQNQSLTLQRNDNYYGQKALLNQVAFQLYSGNPMQLYQTGSIDVAGVSSAYIGLVTDPTNPVSKQLSIFPQLSVSYLGFNTTKPPFDDAKVRQAFSYAVDKSKVLTLSVNDVVALANGILPPDMPGYNAALQGLTFDVQKAKQLISESKYGDISKLPPITLTTGGLGNYISGLDGGVIAQWLQNLGVQVSVRQLEPEIYYYYLNQEKDELYEYGWIADYPDPQDFLDVLFHTGNQNNVGGYSSSQVDALLQKAATETDAAARIQEYQQAEQTIVNDAAVLPLYYGRSYVLIQPYVHGYVLSPLGYARFNQISVTK